MDSHKIQRRKWSDNRICLSASALPQNVSAQFSQKSTPGNGCDYVVAHDDLDEMLFFQFAFKFHFRHLIDGDTYENRFAKFFIPFSI